MDINGGRKIFLSHKGSDKDTVIDFRETLEELGYEPWLDDDAMPCDACRYPQGTWSPTGHAGVMRCRVLRDSIVQG